MRITNDLLKLAVDLPDVNDVQFMMSVVNAQNFAKKHQAKECQLSVNGFLVDIQPEMQYKELYQEYEASRKV